MATITLYCADAADLKLGPGLGTTQEAGQLIVFEKGFATFEGDDFPDWPKWAFHPGTPHVEILEGEEAKGRASTGEGVQCPKCEKRFKDQKALNGHLLSHARAEKKAAGQG